MTDFRCIWIDPDEIEQRHPVHRSDGRFRFSTRRAAEMHDASVAFIQTELEHHFDGPTVIVTHHAPHPWSVPKHLRDDLLNACYASDLSELIEGTQPDLWVHGHIHNACDYESAVAEWFAIRVAIWMKSTISTRRW